MEQLDDVSTTNKTLKMILQWHWKSLKKKNQYKRFKEVMLDNLLQIKNISAHKKTHLQENLKVEIKKGKQNN